METKFYVDENDHDQVLTILTWKCQQFGRTIFKYNTDEALIMQ